MSHKDIILSTVALSIALAGGVWLIWRRISRPEVPYVSPVDLPDDTNGTLLNQSPIANTQEAPAKSDIKPAEDISTNSESLTALAMRIDDLELQEFLTAVADLVQKTGPCFDGETPFRFIEEIVDRMDDLQAIQKNHSGPSAKIFDTFRHALVGVLTDCGVELIHAEHWDPSIQRAIAKESTQGIDATTILRFGSTGIRRHGQLVRKQEVVLAVPQ